MTVSAKSTITAAVNTERQGDIVSELITELGREGLDNNKVIYLIEGLGREYPQNKVVLQLCRALGLDSDDEREESEYPWILFSLGGTAYAINSKFVLSIEILNEITPIVDAPGYSPGITRSRGEMIDILDMRALFGIGDYVSAKSEDDNVYMMVVMEVQDAKRGLIVDEIISVEYISKFDSEIMCQDGGMNSSYVGKVARRERTDEPVLILKPETLITL